MADTPFVDPAMFFNILFGSERFEPYIGRLKLSHMASAFGDALKLASASGEDGEGGEKEGQPAGQQEQQQPGPEDVFGAHFQGDRAARVQNLREVRADGLVWCMWWMISPCVGGWRPLSDTAALALSLTHTHIYIRKFTGAHRDAPGRDGAGPLRAGGPGGVPRLGEQGGGALGGGRLWAPDAGRGKECRVCGMGFLL